MPFQSKVIENFLGAGLTFPLVIENGRAKLVTGFDLIRSSISTILSWPHANRFFLSEFGSRMDELLEEPNDEALDIMIEHFVIEAINTWEKRVRLLDVQIEKPEPHAINIRLHYQIVNTQSSDSFIYPFYNKIIY